MNIGRAAKLSGVSAKMIRHYESIGLFPKPLRTNSGYRIYAMTDVHTLKFVKRARALGFSMADIKKLVGLWRSKTRESAQVKAMALSHIQELEQKIQELKSMSEALKKLTCHCHGDERPNCPILDDLASE
ncbi:MAG: Cu(I)-responsive transcriptional regulator [Oligoflexia bacterium]|nr:Cu(I)-responsive transcriptional regulator [Oligoflexia bacterium]